MRRDSEGKKMNLCKDIGEVIFFDRGVLLGGLGVSRGVPQQAEPEKVTGGNGLMLFRMEESETI